MGVAVNFFPRDKSLDYTNLWLSVVYVSNQKKSSVVINILGTQFFHSDTKIKSSLDLRVAG